MYMQSFTILSSHFDSELLQKILDYLKSKIIQLQINPASIMQKLRRLGSFEE